MEKGKMDNLSDLDLCKRIAEIEGLGYVTRKSITNGEHVFADTQNHTGMRLYNPLTDDALCFQLMVKYELHLNPDHTTKIWSACDGAGHYENIHYNKSPNKAICLAMIEANK